MARILTVDDARAVRVLVKKALNDLGLEIHEAENGEQGLEVVEARSPDLILLDVTMPVLDGPGMLARLRARRCMTPVLLLTAESGSSVIGPLLRQGGVLDYVVKPFNPQQLRAKVVDALQRQGVLEKPAAAQAQTSDPRAALSGGKPTVDVLVIDDMENVAKKLQTLLPENLGFEHCADASTAIQFCRERAYRAIIVDNEIPGVNTNELVRDLRILQPNAAFVALCMRAFKNPQSLCSKDGFSSYIVKPFELAQIEGFIGTYFESQDLLQVEGNVLTPRPCKSDAAADAFFGRLQPLMIDAAKAAAAACHERLILDLSSFPASSKLQKLLVRLALQSQENGLALRVVGGAEIAKLMRQLVETAGIPVSENIDAAKAA